MPRRVLAAAAVIVATLSAAGPAAAGDASLVWRTIETQHFIVHYYEPLDDVARRIAVVAERSHAVLSPALQHVPEVKTQVVVVDDTDGANGFASVVPRNAIRIFATAPTSLSVLNDHDDWLYGLFAHEYAHILHLDSIAGLPRLVNKIVGKTWAPNQVQPRWVIEGIATYQESKRTSSGRTRNALFDMFLRVPVLAGVELDIDAVSTGPRRFPHGTAAYLYGAHFLKYVFDRHGDDKLAEMSWSYGSNPIPWGLNRSVKEATGQTFIELYDEWRRYMGDKYAMQLEAIERRGRREGRRLTFSGEGNFNPQYTSDGSRIVWLQSDGHRRARFRSMPRDANVGQAEDYAIINRVGGYMLLRDGSMIAEQTHFFRTDYAYQDLILWDRRTGKTQRLTRGMRARDPVVSPDERQVAFVVNGASRSELAIMPLRADAEPTVVWGGPDRFDQVSVPRWSPDGGQIAFSAWRKGGYRDILIHDLASGHTRELSRDRALDTDPVFSPDGRYLFYASDRSGIYNIYAHELESGETWQVTNVVGCAVQPSVSPDGKYLAYQGFDVDGWELYELELDRSRWLPAELYIDDRPDPVDIPDDSAQVSAPRRYRPLETLAPQSYEVSLVSDSFGSAVNVQTGGSDIVGLHAYSLGATIGLERGNVSVGTSYAYRRLWPSLRLAAVRSHNRRGGAVIDGRNTLFTEEQYRTTASVGLPVLRTEEAQGTLSFDYDMDWLLNAGDSYQGPDPNELLPRLPTDLFLAGLAMRFSYSDVRGVLYGVGAQEGQAFGASIRINDPALGSDLRSLSLDYRWETYRRLWGVSPTLAVRVTGGIRSADNNRLPGYALGGIPQQDVVRAILDSTRVGNTGFLRGYPSRVVIGRQYSLANVEYRQLLFDIERGVSTLPFYVRRLHFAALLDAGSAWNDDFSLGEVKVGVGGSLRLDMVFGFFVPGSLDIGYARGLSEGGVDQYWLLLTSTL